MKRASIPAAVGLWICSLVLILLTACGGEEEAQRGAGGKAPETTNAADKPFEPSSPQQSSKTKPEKGQIEDPALRAAFIAARQAEVASSPEYAFAEASHYSTTLRAKGDARIVTHRALSHAKKMQTELVDDGGVRVTPLGRADEVGEQAFELKLTAWGSGVRTEAAPPITTRVVQGNRIELERELITEWYVNGPLGLEQGFTVKEPREASDQLLVFELSVHGARPVLDTGGKAVSFFRGSGVSIGGYSDLFVKDANGQRLTASLAVADDKIRISVEAKGATFPIVIDPLIWIGTKLMQLDDDASQFGYSVALSGETALVGTGSGAAYVFVRSGDSWIQQQKLNVPGSNSVALSGNTALIGAPYDDEIGAAYVFVRSGSSWSQQQKLVAPDGAAFDNFGYSVALSGNTALIGSRNDGSSGSAYVFVRTGSNWAQQQKLSANDSAASDNFGHSVALSGDTALIGAPYDDDNGLNSGSAYVFMRSGSFWAQEQKLLANDNAAEDAFGYSVALSGDTALVGAFYDDDTGKDSGSAYVFVRTSSSWTQQQKLLAPDGAANDYFGYSVAISGDTALVGASLDDDNGDNSGMAYVFERTGSSWALPLKLSAPDGAAFDNFGTAVALSGSTALVGALYGRSFGYTSVFALSGSSWAEQQKLLAFDETSTDNFGVSVAISGDTALIGADADDDKGIDSGSAYVFVRSGNSWDHQQKLLASDGAAGDRFGASVALSGNTALIGANSDDEPSAANCGSAYVFVRSGVTWTQQKLLAPDRAANDNFGASVALSGDTALIGANRDDDGGSGSGSAYVFLRTGTLWEQQQKLTASDGAANDNFGGAVALSGDTALIGASFDNEGDDISRGSAYVFVRSGVAWAPQQKLLASDGAAFDYFGNSVALSGDTAIVGAMEDDDRRGSAYVFVRSGNSWAQQQKLLIPDGVPDDSLGVSVAVSGDMAVIGAHFDDDKGTDSGSAHVFARNGTVWTEQQKLFALDSRAFQIFGSAVALSGDTALVAAFGSAAYAFRLYDSNFTLGAPCSVADQCSSGNCVEGVCCDDDCTGACQSCAQWRKADNSSDGTCRQVTTGSACGPAPNSCISKTEYALTPICTANGACQPQTTECTAGFACVTSSVDGFCASDCRSGDPLDRLHSRCAQTHWCDIDGACKQDRAGGQPCSDNEQCTSDSCGSNGVCKKDNGAACSLPAECGSNHCIDGFCCDSSCGVRCEACDIPGKLGICSPVPAGEEPHHLSCQDSALPCGTGRCDGSTRDECFFLIGTPCGPSSCEGGTVSGDLCNAAGACVEDTNVSCGRYICADPTACGTSCDSHDHCATGSYCNFDSNTCVAKLNNNQNSCTENEQCSSDNCIDGFCCNDGCNDPCEACDIPGSEGTCAVVPEGEAPHHGRQCKVDAHPDCGGYCDGSSVDDCAFDEGTPCGAVSCDDETDTLNGFTCSETGLCVTPKSTSCGPYACGNASSCATSCTTQADCSPFARCDLETNSCVGKLEVAQACASPAECNSDNCVDGFCCNDVCNQQCEACDVTGNEGICTAVTGAPHGARPACSGTDPTCGGQCDGEKRDGCSFPTNATLCGEPYCTAGVAHPLVCNSQGSCVDGTTKNCAPFSCNDAMSACGTSCTNDLDCASGATCDAQASECAFTDGTCQPDGFTIKLSNGEERSCAPFVCQNGKGCLRECAGNNECAAGYACSGDKCEESPDSPSNTAGQSGDPDGSNPADDSSGGGGGCTITNTGAALGGSRFILAAAALALGIRMRRGRLIQPGIAASSRQS